MLSKISCITLNLINASSCFKTITPDRYRLIANVDQEGRNSLHYAVLFQEPHFEEVYLMIVGFLYNHDLFSELFLQRDKQGRTPLDYAIMFKKFNISKVYSVRTMSLLMPRFTVEHQAMIKKHRPDECASIEVPELLSLDIAKKYLGIKGLSVESIDGTANHRELMLQFISVCLANGLLAPMKWLLIDSGYPMQRLLGYSEVSLQCHAMVREMFEGSSYERLLDQELEGVATGLSADQLRARLKCAFYDYCRGWGTENKGVTLFEYSRNQAPQTHLRDEVLLQIPDQQGLKLFSEYIQRFFRGVNGGGVRVAARLKLAEYLMTKTEEGAETRWLHYLVQSSQFFLFVTWIDRRQLDLDVWLIKDREMLAFSNDMPWMHSKGRYIGGGVTIGQFLCAMAVVADNHLAFNWLLPQIDEGKFLEMNLAQLAASSGSYLVLKLLALRTFPRKGYFEDSINSFRLAVQGGHHHVAEHLLMLFGNKFCFKGDAQLIKSYYALDSSCFVSSLWRCAATKIQSRFRGCSTRRKQTDLLALLRLLKVWGAVIRELSVNETAPAPTWTTLKMQCELVVDSEAHGIDEIGEIMRRVGLTSREDHHGEDEDEDEEEVSRILSSSGDTDVDGLAEQIWFVCHHDDISRCVRLIDESANRLSRQLTVQLGIEEAESVLQLGEDDVLIDPTGNCPLKVYRATGAEVASMIET
eukprot:gene34193-42161_t